MIGRLISSFLQDDVNAALHGDGTAMAHLGAEAFGKGRVVEAAYWMVMADLRGFLNLEGVLTEYTAAWVAKGCPEKDDSTCLSEYQQAFARSALRWLANQDKTVARAWFEKAAGEGNAEAVAFLRKHG